MTLFVAVRMAASECLPYLLECAKIKGVEYTNTLWHGVLLPQLLNTVDTEPESDIKAEHMYALAQVKYLHYR